VRRALRSFRARLRDACVDRSSKSTRLSQIAARRPSKKYVLAANALLRVIDRFKRFDYATRPTVDDRFLAALD
jgi:hypothetical protein